MVRGRHEILGTAGAKLTLIFENKDQDFEKVSFNDNGIEETIVRVICITNKRNRNQESKTCSLNKCYPVCLNHIELICKFLNST